MLFALRSCAYRVRPARFIQATRDIVVLLLKAETLDGIFYLLVLVWDIVCQIDK